MPDVPKHSAGYFCAPGMDLVDLFIGSEGTLGVIARGDLQDRRRAGRPRAARSCRCRPKPRRSRWSANCARRRRRRGASRDPRGIDIAAIEHIDARSIAVVREDGVDRKLEITLPPGAAVVLLIDLELSADDGHDLWSELESIRDPDAADTPLVRFCRLLDRHGVLDDDRDRVAGRSRARRGVCRAARSGAGRRQSPRRAGASRRDPRDLEDRRRHDRAVRSLRRDDARVPPAVRGARSRPRGMGAHLRRQRAPQRDSATAPTTCRKGREAILELGAAVIAMGGCPLAEHGVGRSPIKQQLLRQLYGEAGIDAMRAIKLSLDPNGSLAPGVIFPPQ